MITQDPIFNRSLKAAKQHTHGVQQSRESVDRQEKEGILERRQRGILGLLGEAGPMGKTALEIEQATGEGHGKVSGALSAMHRDGMISALKLDRRNGHGVYVLNSEVGNRLTRAYQPNAKGGATPQASTPARPRLTDEELRLAVAVRQNLNANPDGIQRLHASTARTLLNALDQLNA